MSDIKVVGIAGAGFMGCQIAVHAAFYGYKVNAFDISEESIEKARSENLAAFNRGVYQVKSQSQQEEIIARINYTTDFEAAFGEVDLAIEAVPEKVDLKREIWSKLDRTCPPHAILGTNSSSMKVSSLEDATERPEKVLNIHYASPIPERHYVELMGGSKTSPETIDTVADWVRNQPDR